MMRRTFATYITDQPEAVTLKEKLNEAEAALAGARNKMKLGYTDPQTGEGVVLGTGGGGGNVRGWAALALRQVAGVF